MHKATWFSGARRGVVRLLCAAFCLMAFSAAQAQAQAQAQASASAGMARGLIVQLREAPNTSGRDAPQALRERLQGVAQSSGLSGLSTRAIGPRHHLMALERPLRGAELDDMVRRLQFHPEVLSVEPDVLIRRQAVPNDPLFASRQWHLQTPAIQAAALNLPPAWDRSTGNAITVAVLDTGIRPGHPDLVGQLLPGYDFISEVEFANDGDGRDADPTDPGDWITSTEAAGALFSGCTVENSSWHGTFIAGQIAAATHNGLGVAGVSWGARILPVRVSGKCGAFLSDILDAMRWSAGLNVAGIPPNANPARIINLSFGGDAACSSTYQSVIDEVTAAGSLMVVAAGNEGGALRRPADCRNVLAVGAVRADGLKASYSNSGANVALMAPGGDGTLPLTSLDNTGVFGPGLDTYGSKIGTSFSAPLASGVAALMLSVNPALSPAEIVARMQQGVRGHTANPSFAQCVSGGASICNCTTAACGAGLLDAAGALSAAFNPVARPVASGTLQPGGQVVLNGAGSLPASGAVLAGWLWTQVGGPAISLSAPNGVTTSFVLPTAAGDYSFRLLVTDSLGRTAFDSVVVTSVAGSSDGGAASGGGGGALGLGGLGALWALVLAVVAADHRRRRA